MTTEVGDNVELTLTVDDLKPLPASGEMQVARVAPPPNRRVALRVRCCAVWPVKLCASFQILLSQGQGMAGDRDFSGRRWLSIALRSFHLVGVVLASVGLLGTGTHSVAGVVLMLLTGFGLFALDLWQHTDLWREVAGAFIVVKLLVLLVMLLVPKIAGLLFWLVLISSSVVSHAPHDFRHRRILG